MGSFVGATSSAIKGLIEAEAAPAGNRQLNIGMLFLTESLGFIVDKSKQNNNRSFLISSR
jgi:hypothetical protein